MAKAKNLVIVESPAKAKTINKFLGPDYLVEASMGHVKDLPKSKLGVDEEKDFAPTYRVLPKKKDVLAKLRKLAKDMDGIWLATDPDREGEAIGWHLAEELGNGRAIHRVLLTEITKRGVQEAFSHPTEIDLDKVNAQQARRILDRLVGYKISPLLWDKIRRGLSAGRVQSVALRMIVERQREIDAFVSEEYWTLEARVEGEEPPELIAKLHKIGGEDPTLGDEAATKKVMEAVQEAEWKVSSVDQKKRRRNPPPPYITSKLQQDASRHLRFSVKKTMTLAQRLYEGKDLGTAGTVGLITYMRTDSTRVSDQALDEVRGHIGSSFGDKYLPDKPRTFKARKGAQEAHEAIRPTSLELSPDDAAKFLEKDELKLYRMIWNRFVASQMKAAVFLDTRVDIPVGEALFRARGSVMQFDGFLAAYRGAGKSSAEPDDVLPPIAEGDVLELKELLPEQHFTQPPPHYNEASLVKALEENGIGRPSTYAAILDKIQVKDYVRKEKRKFHPTELGMLVSDQLTKGFDDLINVGYTARMEETLDEIERGKKDWVQALGSFHEKFLADLEKAEGELANLKAGVETDEKCEKCGAVMLKKIGRFGPFLACSAYPECKNTRDLDEEETPEVAPEVEQETCPKCGKEMTVKRGRFGPFLACTGYPECKTTKNLVEDKEGRLTKAEEKTLDEECPKCGGKMVRKIGRYGPFEACGNYPDCKYIKQEETGVDCPREGCEGKIVKKRGRRKAFYGCDQYPECDFVLWQKPITEPCPDCGAPFLLRKVTKKKGPHLICHEESCDYERILDDEDGD